MNTGSRSKAQIIRSHTITYFNILNLVLAALVVISGQYKNMLFMGIVIFNSLIGIIQELKVKSLIDKLSVITATKAKRIKGEEIEEIPISQIQKEDCLLVTAGDQIVADCTVLTSDGLEVNESLLTGESVPVLKKAGDTLYSGSFITAGTGTGRVLHTGEENYATQLVRKAQTKRRATSEMQDAIKKIIRYVSYTIIPIGMILFCIQYYRVGNSFPNSLVNTVAGVLGMIPEGLVLLTSVSFILGVGRLARKRALVQEIEAIEALARVNILCLDKTGTITTGELMVEKVLPLGASEAEIENILGCMAYTFIDVNATGKALQNYFHDGSQIPVTERLPFSSTRKFMGITTDTSSYLLGAPDFLTSDDELLNKAESYSQKGLRVLLLCSCPILYRSPDEIRQSTPLALIVLADCVKENAMDIFNYFAKQGVDVKIISGDNPATVSYVGQQAGIPNAEQYVNAATLPEDFDALRKEVKKYAVFGRVTPEQKQQIIKAYQANGKIVGMVGDGINDVLALKDSDCGIAMANGADAAKQSAHIVLLDSDFSSMPDIAKEGRTIIANIERVSALYLTKTIYSVLLCVIFIIIGKSYPFIPIQLSLIGATAIGIPSFLLTLEKNDEVTTHGFLRHVLHISLPAAIILVAILCAIQIFQAHFGWSPVMTRTLNLLSGGILSLSVVGVVCRPWNRRRTLILFGITLIFAGAFFLFPDFFSVVRFLPVR